MSRGLKSCDTMNRLLDQRLHEGVVSSDDQAAITEGCCCWDAEVLRISYLSPRLGSKSHGHVVEIYREAHFVERSG